VIGWRSDRSLGRRHRPRRTFTAKSVLLMAQSSKSSELGTPYISRRYKLLLLLLLGPGSNVRILSKLRCPLQGPFSTPNLKCFFQVSLVQLTLRLRACKLLARYLSAIDPMSCRRSDDAPVVAIGLYRTGYPKGMTEAFVFNDSTLINRPQLIVRGVGQRDARRSDLDLAIGILIDVEILGGVASVLRRVRQQISLRS
jgi:hypothetical protein